MVSCWRGLDEVPAGWKESAVTIGVFDGVHRGHRHVVERAAARGRELGVSTLAVSFDPRPVDVLAPDKAPPMLTTVATRVRLLGEAGADAVLLLPFSRELSQLEPEDFVRTTLVERLQARAIVVGEDFRFGHRAAGDVALLAKLGETYDFAVERVAAVGEQGASYSSSWVRERIAAGDVAAAAHVLDRPHRLEGTVVRGDGRGRDLGFPTANVACPPNTAVPADGVYAGWLLREGRPEEQGVRQDGRLPAAVSIGTNPTFSGETRQVEAYVLDRDDLELYGARVTVEFVARLRDTLRFESVEQLMGEMVRDVRRVRAVLRRADVGPGTLLMVDPNRMA